MHIFVSDNSVIGNMLFSIYLFYSTSNFIQSVPFLRSSLIHLGKRCHKALLSILIVCPFSSHNTLQLPSNRLKNSLLRMHRYQCFRLYRLHHLLYPRPVDVPAGVKTRPFPVPPQSPVKLKAEIINPVPYPLVVYELSSSKASLEEYMYVPPFGCMSRNAWKS